jgi:hypothetical protein
MANEERLENQAEVRDQWREAKRSPFSEFPIELLGKAEKAQGKVKLSTWARRYFPRVFYLPFSEDHIAALDTIQKAIEKGGNFALCLPRGWGKSTMVKVAVVWALLTGRRKYVVALAAKGDLAREILAFLQIALMENEKLAADYPVLATFIKHTEGKPQKATGILYPSEEPTEDQLYTNAGIVYNTAEIRLPYFPYAIWSEACLQTDGITSSIRGKTITLRDGSIVRPDFAFLDDLSTREASESHTSTNRLERLVNGDVLALAGPGVTLSAICTCTITQRDDLADRLTNRELNPQWQGSKGQAIYDWPSNKKIWEEYQAIRKQDILEDTNNADQYYRDNQEEMHRGSRVSWEANHVKGSTALKDAYDTIVRIGLQAYLSEYQNSPLALILQPYELTRDAIVSHANSLPRGTMPTDTLSYTLMADINYSGIHWAYVGFQPDHSAHVADYGKFPEHEVLYNPKNPKQGEEAEIFTALVQFKEYIVSKGYRLDIASIDLGNWLSTVEKYLGAHGKDWPCRVFGSRGRANNMYRVPKSALMSKEHMYLSPYRSGVKVITHNACRLRERMQKSFLLSMGIPQGITLFGQPMEHSTLAEHILAETLAEIREGRHGLEYLWEVKGINDLCDAVVGCYALAEAVGLGGLAVEAPKKRLVAKRRKRRGLVQ